MASLRLTVLPVLAVFALGACIATAAPRLPADVATALHSRDMRRLETQSLRVYYPEGRQDEARRVAERLEGCVAGLRLRTALKGADAERKMTVLLPEVPFNNAFVAVQAGGYAPLSVIPTLNTWDFQTELGLPPDPAWIGCHEIVHYVHQQQVRGLWAFVNKVFGEVITPQVGLDAWFWEGLATTYESRFQPGTGRMASPVWHGFFHAAVAERGIWGGDLSELNRRFHFANHYLYGSFFITFLIERHGEAKLWELIADQGGSIVFFLFVSPRFYGVYKKSLSSLIDDFGAWAKRRFPRHERPAGQRTIRPLGEDVRWARAATGREAFVIGHADAATELVVRDADGTLVRRRRLNEILPPRRLEGVAPVYTSGLSFTADGRELYFAALTSGLVEQEVRLVRYDVAADTLHVVTTLSGPGGSLSPDGTRYYYAAADGDRHDLAYVDLATGQRTWVAKSRERQYVSDARVSPDGQKVAMTFFDGERFVIRVVPVNGGASGDYVAGEQSAQPAWIDDENLVFLGESHGQFQVFHVQLGGRPEQLSQAPYLAFAPLPAGAGKVRFLNREGFGYTLDEIDVAAVAVAPEPSRPPMPPPTPLRADLQIASDRPYSWTDGFFYPQLRSLILQPLSTSSKDLVYGLTVGGADRLEMHRWALTVAYQSDPGELSWQLGYALSRFAPWFVVLSASELRWAKHDDPDDEDVEPVVVERDRQRVGQLTIARAWGGFDLGLLGVVVEDEEHDTLPRVVDEDKELAGAGLAISYTGADGSRESGAQHLLAASAAGTFYPGDWSTLGEDFVDARGQLTGRLPLPLHGHVELSLRAHALAGLDGRNDLQVGGASALIAFYESRESPGIFASDVFPDPVVFYEPLRGFSDVALFTDRIGIADLTLRWPYVIDHGWASTAFLFPPVFVRQLDLELFGAGASDGRERVGDDLHVAAGAALGLRLAIWRAPLTVRYQVARRLTDDDAWLHEVGLLFEL